MLLNIFSESLGLPSDYIRLRQHKNAEVPSYLYAHYYPKSEKPLEEEWGVGAHKDSSIFTILTQTDGEKGLEFMPEEECIPILMFTRAPHTPSSTDPPIFASCSVDIIQNISIYVFYPASRKISHELGDSATLPRGG
jgi:hypothetical protein